LGFQPHDGEGKTMALAAYGKAEKNIINKVDKLIKTKGDSYEVNSDFFYSKRHEKYKSFTKKFIEEFGEPLSNKNDISEYYKNLAYAVQYKLEQVVLMLVKKIYSVTKDKYFCFAGGTFMNCKLNGKVAKEDFVKNLFVNPLSADNGISLGAALYAANELGCNVSHKLRHTYYGPEYANSKIKQELDNFKDNLHFKKVENISEEAAKLISQSKIIGWFQGRMEAGARALGNRSILANPLDGKAKDIVNSRVKFREMWRPFCPSVIIEDAKNYFDIKVPSEFMIIAADAKEKVAELIPSVVHVDNTVRPQEVSKDINPKYWELIYNFGKITKHPVILNTSFNVKNEPVICSPREAIKCFLNTDIDYLCIGDFLVSKTKK
jgi:carbamoyltransferase